MSGYGWTDRKSCPSKLSAIKAAIRSSRAIFMEADLLPVERLSGLPTLIDEISTEVDRRMVFYSADEK